LNQKARITAIRECNGTVNRLVELGVVPGQIISLLKKAPLGDPMEFRIMNYHLCLRKAEAAVVEVELVEHVG